MEKLIITAGMGDQDVLGKLKCQLDDAQKVAGQMEQYLAEARNILFAYSRKSTNLQYTNFCEMVIGAAQKAERLTEKLRRLTLDTKRYEDYKSDLVLIHGISLTSQNGILEVSMPVLIPHRKESYTDYLYKPLHTACQHWCQKRAELGEEIPAYKRCTVCFVHIYDESLPLSRVRDHDNYEEKHVLDVLSNFFLASDNGMYVDTCHLTRLGKADKTILFVMNSEEFPAWIARFQSAMTIEKAKGIFA